MNPPLAINAVRLTDQYPAGTDLLHSYGAAQFGGQFLGPHAGGALPFEQLVAFENNGGVKYGYGKYSHFFCLFQLN